ncbi:S41 family peptidase [Streptomyces sp. MST-110588]|uniref:S41 family peptidase n=1 Tax=Streptomyces sp. MST-110588 TaxID=2833628 RepID=UPI001F5C6AE7|nr:S41 family peptidase [Streptomyces sp. MST-110588]UNO42841.1 S41 family peptidase [Streptomyces sp. MST-110588]
MPPAPARLGTARVTGPRPGRRTGALALVLAAVTALAGTACSGTAPPRAPRPDGEQRPASVQGVWRMDGYGTLVTVRGRQLRTYDTTAVSCLPGILTGTRKGDPDAPGRAEFDVPGSTLTVVPQGGDRARLSAPDNAGYRSLRRLDALPARCRQRPAKDPRAVFDVFWRTYAENYPFFAAKKIDWSAVRDRYRPRITARTTDDELFAVLRDMIEPLHDAHTSVDGGKGRRYAGLRPGTKIPSPADMKKMDAAIAANLGPGVTRRQWARGKLSYADLPGHLGYFRVTGFIGYTAGGSYAADVAELDRALDAIFTKARTHGPEALRGLIIDLRLNGGGADPLGLRIASRLTDRPYLAYRKHARNDPRDPKRFTAPQPITVRPYHGPRYTGPTAVLTGRLTISAGETFTQALMGRGPAPVRIGENTQGVFSDTMDRTLPNGWTFSLPNEEFMTARGRTYDGTGIPPAIRTPVFTDQELDARRDSALTRARELLGKHGS